MTPRKHEAPVGDQGNGIAAFFDGHRKDSFMIAQKTTHLQHPLLALIAARNFLTLKQQILNGEAQRCPVCLSWITRRDVGSLAVYIPNGNEEPIAYAVCERCVQKATTKKKRRAAIAKAEAYLRSYVADGQEAAQ